MNKTLSIEIMTISKLRNNFLKNRTEEIRGKHTKQRNFCVQLKESAKLFYIGM